MVVFPANHCLKANEGDVCASVGECGACGGCGGSIGGGRAEAPAVCVLSGDDVTSVLVWDWAWCSTFGGCSVEGIGLFVRVGSGTTNGFQTMFGAGSDLSVAFGGAVFCSGGAASGAGCGATLGSVAAVSVL